jgi:hypothetical protein
MSDKWTLPQVPSEPELDALLGDRLRLVTGRRCPSAGKTAKETEGRM